MRRSSRPIICGCGKTSTLEEGDEGAVCTSTVFDPSKSGAIEQEGSNMYNMYHRAFIRVIIADISLARS